MPRERVLVFWWFIAFGLVIGNKVDAQNVTENEIRPYEFTFNIVDFQHRSEKKGNDGLITGEYGFITADGIYHETAYATDKSGDFIITKMKHRKIISLKDAEEIFKDRPEQAKMLAEALMKSCEGCDLSELDRQETSSFVRSESSTISPAKKVESRLEKKLDLAMKEMMKVLNKKSEDIDIEDKLSRKEKKLSGVIPRVVVGSGRDQSPKAPTAINNNNSNNNNETSSNEIIRDMVDAARRVLEISTKDSLRVEEEEELAAMSSDEALERMANDLFYRFNYTITSHGHWEDGFRNGRKDGEYNAKFREGIDTRVKYLSNEFGHQPNITLVPSKQEQLPLVPLVPLVPRIFENKSSDDGKNKSAATPATTTTTTTTTTTSSTTKEPPYTGHYFSWFRK